MVYVAKYKKILLYQSKENKVFVVKGHITFLINIDIFMDKIYVNVITE